MDLLAMQSPASPYLQVTQLSKAAVRNMLWTQPIQVVREDSKYLCIAGVRTLQAARAMVPNEEVPVDVISAQDLPISLDTWAGCDFFLKAFGLMCIRDRSILRAAYNFWGKHLLREIAPGYWSKAAIARAAGYSRQHALHARVHHDCEHD